MATDPKQKALIDAANLLCEYVEENLPPGFEIALVMSHDEALLELYGPDGVSMEAEGGEDNYSSIAAACDTAKSITPSEAQP